MDRILLSSIFRKLPLKLLLIILAVLGVFAVCFSNAVSLPQNSWGGNFFQSDGSYVYSRDTLTVGRTVSSYTFTDYDFVCFNVSRDSSCQIGYSIDNSTFTNAGWQSYTCIENKTFYLKGDNNNCLLNVYYYKNGEGFLLNKSTSLECQTEYNLIPISSVDQNYCTTNNLCPAGGTPSDCPNVGVSNIYINDIFHPGAFNVIMNIPEEIDWDYAYTNSGQNFNIDVVGYNQDFEKIEGWINTNNYKPSSEDFTNIFTSGFSNFGGLLVATLFVILVFYFVKKMFK